MSGRRFLTNAAAIVALAIAMSYIISIVREDAHWRGFRDGHACTIETRIPDPPMAAWRCDDGGLYWRDEEIWP